MMLNRKPHPDQMVLELGQEAELERMIEARVAIRAEADAWRWRVRLILIETLMMSTLIGASGIVLQLPPGTVAGSAFAVGGACLISGLLLIFLSGACGRLMSAVRRWRRS